MPRFFSASAAEPLVDAPSGLVPVPAPQAAPFRLAREVVRDGFATPMRVDHRAGLLQGCLHRADGARVELSRRFGGHRGDFFGSADPERADPPPDAPRREGRGLYLGHLMSAHYGHFLTETLSTFWIFDEVEARGVDYVAFHPFAWSGPLKPYARLCLERFGIDPDAAALIGDRGLRFEEMLVPERLLRLNHSADPRLRRVYARIAAPARTAAGATARRLYLSRRRLDARALRRTVANEVRLEAVFAARGFEIVHPETLDFEAQLRLYASAGILAGISGTALHNCLFMAPETLAIELEDLRYGGPAPTQALCAEIAGTRARFIPFQGRRAVPSRGVVLFDEDHVQAALDRILTDETGETPANAAPPPPTPAERWEIARRVTRPMLHQATRPARSALGRLRGRG